MAKKIEIKVGVSVILLILFAIFLRFITNVVECNVSWDESKYGLWSGCMVKTAQGWMPERNVRVIYWIEGE